MTPRSRSATRRRFALRPRPFTTLIAACIGVLLLAASCAGNEDEAAADPAATPNEAGSEGTTTTRGPLGSGEPVTIAFAGDASFEGLGDSVRANPEGLLRAIGPVLGAADVSIVNLEAAVAEGGDRENKTFAFRVPARALDALAAAGTDVVTMANNHGMDFGASGLAESLAVRESSPVAIIGIGEDADDAYEPFVTEVRGQRIGIIAANDIFDSNLVASWTATDDRAGIASVEEDHQDRFAAKVRELRGRVDTLAVYLHYGTEKETCPNDRQRELVDLLVDAGADIVVGSHAHRLQGVGYHGDRLVAYGLSNFIFRSPSDAGRATGVLTVTATGSRIDGYEWSPAVITDLVPVPTSGDRARAALDRMDELAACAGLSSSPSSTAARATPAATGSGAG